LSARPLRGLVSTPPGFAERLISLQARGKAEMLTSGSRRLKRAESGGEAGAC
jgi:hypothetical protein